MSPEAGLRANDALDGRFADALERLANGLRHHDQRQADAVGLTPLQLRLLRSTATLTGGRRRTGALAAELDVTQPTVSDALRVLAQKGLLDRIEDPQDRRASLAVPATAGRELLGRLEDHRALLAPTLGRLPAAQKGTALEVLLTLIAGMLAGGTISVARTCTTCRFFAPDAHDDDDAPHHCRLLDQPLPLTQLRTDCPEHETAA